ncbi:MAG: hypothetical protein ACFWTJ_08985 [Lachnoclostridium sp.]|jgi:preprotein translocase subunit SecG
MKTTRTIIGIISIVLFIIIILQSCAAGLGNTLSGNNEVSGSAGLLLSLCMLIAGIVVLPRVNQKEEQLQPAVFMLLAD